MNFRYYTFSGKNWKKKFVGMINWHSRRYDLEGEKLIAATISLFPYGSGTEILSSRKMQLEIH